MKTAIALTLACLAVGSVRAQVLADQVNQNINALTGTWKFVVTDEANSLVATSYNVIKKQDNDLVVSDLVWGTTAKATVKDGGVKVPMAALLDHASKTRVNFTTDLPMLMTDGGWWSGSAMVKSSRYKIQGIRLSSIWACNHKEPTHTATSTEEMQALTKEHKCAGWHQVAVQ